MIFVSKYLVKSSSASLLWPYLHFEVVKIVVKKIAKKKLDFCVHIFVEEEQCQLAVAIPAFIIYMNVRLYVTLLDHTE